MQKLREMLPFALCVALYLGFALPLIPVAADDIRMADVFSVDEAGAAAVVRYLCRAGTLELRTFSYGGLFYYVPLLILKCWELLGGAVTDRAVLLAMRGICTAAGIGCLWLTCRIGRLVFGRVAGAAGAFLVMVTPVFLRWSVEAHPDLPQVFWMLWSLLCCCRLCREFSLKQAALASCFAGLAFGTKYAGLFLAPLIALAILLPDGDAGLSLRAGIRRLRERRYLTALILIPAILGAVFALTNPYAFIHFEAFRGDVLFEKEHLSFGHMFRVEKAGFGWLVGLGAVTGSAGGVVFAGYLLYLLTGRVRGRLRLPPDRGILLIWIGLFMGYLILSVNLQAPRHLLPVLPAVLLFVADVCQRGSRRAGRRFAGNPARHLVLPLLLVGLSWGRLTEAAGLFQNKWGRDKRSAEIVAGRWIGEHFPEETSILFDAYAYVPAGFGNVYRTFGQSYPMVNHFEPDLLVVREAIANDYRDRADAARAQMGEEAFLDRHFFYKYLEAGHISSYRRIRAFERIAIYRRTAPRVRAPSAPGARWLDRVKQYAAGKAYGVPAAYQAMGDIHASLGLAKEAERAYRRAREAQGTAVRLYNLAREHLASGRLREARRTFGEIMPMIASKPADYRAAIRHHMAQDYFQAGFYDEAVGEGEKALALNPGLRDASYDLGIFTLAQGDFGRADSLCAEAVRRYGPDARAADLLREMIRKGIRTEGAKRILAARFGGAPSQ